MLRISIHTESLMAALDSGINLAWQNVGFRTRENKKFNFEKFENFSNFSFLPKIITTNSYDFVNSPSARFTKAALALPSLPVDKNEGGNLQASGAIYERNEELRYFLHP